MIRIAETENGFVRGVAASDPRITAFKGIPFAAPPVGENRWRAPQPAQNWEGIKDTVHFAPISVQSTPGLGTDVYCREWHVDPEIPMGEDCLYLNIWTNAKSAEEKLPVLIWFFGGALQWGYPAEMEFDGERIARRGIVVVTVNYRLNVFGFLAHKDLTASQPEAFANFGHLDQQAGIKWVIRNIKAFGGDPENITIAGQSAGGGSVLSQMACPANKGLFQKAVIMSAMIRSPYRAGGVGQPRSLEEAEELGDKFLHFLGVETIEEARKLDAFFIRDKYDQFYAQNGMMFPVLDGTFCVGDPLKLLAEGKCVNVPIMSGNTSTEFAEAIAAADETELSRKAAEIFGEDGEAFLACPQAREKTELGYAQVIGIEHTVKEEFLKLEAGKISTKNYYYRFDPDIPGWDHPGTFHSSDLWFFFETLANCWRPFVGRHYDLARQMCNYWCNFIKTGDPNGEDTPGVQLPVWKSYTAEHPCEMIFGGNGASPVEAQDSEYAQLIRRNIMRNIMK